MTTGQVSNPIDSADGVARDHRSRRLFRWLLVILAVVVIVPTGLVVYRWHVRLRLIDELEAHAEVVSQRNYPDWMWNLLGDRMRGLERIERVDFGPYSDPHPPFEEPVSIVARLGVPTMTIAHWQTNTQAAIELAGNPQLVSLEVWSFSRETHRVYGKPGSPVPITQTMSERFFSELMKSESLQTLKISGTRLPANVFSMISRCKSLKELSLEVYAVDGGEAGAFGDLPALTSLSLSGSFVTDSCLESLTACPELKVLAISDAAISDDGLKSLVELKQLDVIQISGSPITPGAVAELQAALPDCLIMFEPASP